MNRKMIFTAAIVLCGSLPYAYAGDILDEYVGQLLAKTGNSKDHKMKQLLEESLSPVKEISKPDTITANEAAAVTANVSDGKQKPGSDNNIQTNLDVTRGLRDKLKESSISSLPVASGSSIDSQLKDVLSQLKSLRFGREIENVKMKKRTKPAELVEEVAESVNVIEEKKSAKEVTKEQKHKTETEFAPKLSINDSEVVDEFELAESLFRIGDKENALKYYRKALNKTISVGKKANPKRAWILFQLGNCLYNINKVDAIKIYEQLIEEHPGSEWTNCARTKKQLLKWLLVEKPIELTMTDKK